MSSPTAPRPGAPRRPGAPSAQADNKPTVVIDYAEYIEDGDDVNLDPATASIGFLGSSPSGESAEIVEATFGKSNFKEGQQSAMLKLKFKRAATGKVTFQDYAYGYWSVYAPTKDGNKLRVRPEFIKERGFTPKPNQNNPGVLFLQSIKDAGGTDIIARINTEGIKALVGLQVHVRQRTVEGRTKPLLLVDYLEGAGAPAPAQTNPNTASVASTAVAPAAEAAPLVQETNSEAIDGLAEAALLDVLGAAENNTIVRNQIPAKIIGIDKWRDHADRQAILQKLRDNAFLTREGAPWTVKGTSVILG